MSARAGRTQAIQIQANAAGADRFLKHAEIGIDQARVNLQRIGSDVDELMDVSRNAAGGRERHQLGASARADSIGRAHSGHGIADDPFAAGRRCPRQAGCRGQDADWVLEPPSLSTETVDADAASGTATTSAAAAAISHGVARTEEGDSECMGRGAFLARGSVRLRILVGDPV